MHMACGRDDKTVTGCVRTGIKVWHIISSSIESQHQLVPVLTKRIIKWI
jgi:hypothetical protein